MSTASDRLAAYIAAEQQVLAGQEVRFDGLTLRLADLAVIQKQIQLLKREVDAEQRQAANPCDVGPRALVSNMGDRERYDDSYGRLYTD